MSLQCEAWKKGVTQRAVIKPAAHSGDAKNVIKDKKTHHQILTDNNKRWTYKAEPYPNRWCVHRKTK